jgi:lantibiotic modifying enzyme
MNPLLEGDAAAEARVVVDAIAAELGAPVADPSLAGGSAGIAVFWAFLAKVAAAEGHHAQAARAGELAAVALDAALDTVARVPMNAGLFSGFTGVAWAVEQLRNEDEREDPGEEVDAALLGWLGQSPWSHAYDLVSGLAGVGVYALERMRCPEPGPRGAAATCLARVVDRLEELAQHRPEGMAWHTPSRLVPAQQGAPEGYDDLGLAHGVPGVVALLAAMIGAGVETRRASVLLDGAVRWVLAQDTPRGFRAWAGPGVVHQGFRVAWCYGDLGVAAALTLAAHAADEPAWERVGLAVARRAAAKPFAESGIVDAGLCHGAAGVAHVLGRIAHRSGDQALADAARALFARTLAMRLPGEGAAGFPARIFPDDAPGGRWQADPGLLCGAAGVGLALLAATSTIAPAWDRVLLISS